MIIDSWQKLHNEGDTEIQAGIDSKTVKLVNHTKSLGHIIDGRFSWGVRIDGCLCKRLLQL